MDVEVFRHLAGLKHVYLPQFSFLLNVIYIQSKLEHYTASQSSTAWLRFPPESRNFIFITSDGKNVYILRAYDIAFLKTLCVIKDSCLVRLQVVLFCSDNME